MDPRNPYARRLSLSTSNITSPLAESTHINGSRLFPPVERYNSSSRLFEEQNVRNSPKMPSSPINKIDLAMYTNIQSRGLTSRIVKYHDNNTKLNRSLSTNTLYQKPGNYPVVNLQKKQLICKPAQRTTVSRVRIAPPEKCLFRANTRSSIMRTGSIVPTVYQQNNDQLSTDNIPIFHADGNDLTPTKSVLDALREISRKRINSDDDSNSRIKKYCVETEELSNDKLSQDEQSTPVMMKRQREVYSPSSLSKSMSPPDQLAKKRICTNNNDILSSLSSSLSIISQKRKRYEPDQKESSGKQLRKYSPPELRLNQQSKKKSSEIEGVDFVDQITPLPATPAVESTKFHEIVRVESRGSQDSHSSTSSNKSRLTLFNKNYDEVPVRNKNSVDKIEDPLSSIAFVKPKKSLQSLGNNSAVDKTKKSKLALMLSGLRGELNDDFMHCKVKSSKNRISSPPEASIQNDDKDATMSQPILFETKTTSSITTVQTATTVGQTGGREKASTSEVNALSPISFGNVAEASKATTTPTSTIAETKPITAPDDSKQTSNVAESSKLPTTGFVLPNNSNTSIGVLSGTVQSDKSTAATSVGSSSAQPVPMFSFGIPASTAVSTAVSKPLVPSTTAVTSAFMPQASTADNKPPQSSASVIMPQCTMANKPTGFTAPTSIPTISTSSAPSLGFFGNKPPSFSLQSSNSLTGTTSVQSATTFSQLSSIDSGFQSSLEAKPPTLFALPKTQATTANSLNFNSLQKPEFTFGISSAQTSQTNSTPTFGMISPATTVATSSPSQSSLFSLPQSGALSSFKPSSNTFSSPTTTVKEPAFGVPTSNAPNPSGGFSFNPSNNETTGLTANKTFSFSATAPATTKASFSFNSTAEQKPSGGFSFGVPSTTTAATTSAPSMFSFAVDKSKPSSGFTLAGSSVSTKPAESSVTPFTFATLAQGTSSSSSTGQENKTNAFTFGVSGSGLQQTNPGGSTIFGSGNTGVQNSTNATISFGNPTSQNTTPSVFGLANPNTIAETKFIPSFGTVAASTPNFGLGNTLASPNVTPTKSESAFVTPQKAGGGSIFSSPTAAPSIFSTPKAENSTGSFIFGNKSEATAVEAGKGFSFGTSKPSGGFSFGSSNNESKNVFSSTNNNGPAPSSFTFGVTNNNENAKPTFGTPNNNATQFNSSLNQGNQPKTFNFGSTNAAPPSNLFGAPAASKPNSTFNFTSIPQNSISNNNNNTTFNFGSAPKSGFAFGTPAPQQSSLGTNNAATSFTFGASSANPANTFNVGNSQGLTFAVGTAQSNNAMNSNSLKLSSSGDRLIRKAARRLPKSATELS